MRRLRRRSGVLLASLGVAIGALLLTPVATVPAQANRPPLAATLVGGPSAGAALFSGRTAEQVHNQDLVDDVVERMWQSRDTSGFARSTVDIEELTVEIMWKGNPPADVKRLVGTTKDGVRVSIVKVPYSAREINAAGARVLQTSRKGKTSARAYATYANEAFDGLVVEVDAADLARAESVRTERARFVSQFASQARVPVTLRQGAPSVEASRWNDTNGSWHGGAGMTRGPLAEPFNFCSTGFAVLVPSGPRAGEGRLLSAGHCDLNQAGTAFLDTAWNDGNGDRLTEGGPDVWVDENPNNGTDSLVMDPVGGTVGKIYGGPWDATSSYPYYVLSVGSAYHNSVGDYVCTGGANSGAHCGVQISNLNVSRDCMRNLHWTCLFHMIVDQTDVAIVIGGDSGGPVYAVRSDGRVSARGIINQGDLYNDVVCPRFRYSPGVYYWNNEWHNRCWSVGYMSPITTILDRWVKDIETSP